VEANQLLFSLRCSIAQWLAI